MIRRNYLVLLGMAIALCPATISAQDPPALLAVYGEGAHAYFSGDIFEAHRLLTQAIDGGIQDPRAYYFRAMTLRRMGRDEEAEADMEAGATFEAQAPSGAYSVDRSIQRIQGRDRLALEEVRRRVRFDIEQQRRAESARRLEQSERREEVVLRVERHPSYEEAIQLAGGTEPADESGVTTQDGQGEQVDTPPAEGVEGVASAIDAPPAETADTTQPDTTTDQAAGNLDPFAGTTDTAADSVDTAEDTAAPAAEVEAGEQVPATRLLGILGNIFGDAVGNSMPQPPMVEGGIGPFGESSATTGAPPADAGGPFGGADPFGGATPTGDQPPPAEADDPFGGSDPFGGVDPFGGSDAGQPPQNEAPTGNDDADNSDAADPFGGGDSDAAAEDADPFGGEENPFG